MTLYSFFLVGRDYELATTSVIFSSGVFQVCVNLTILDDEIVENNETFILTLTSSDPAVLTGNTGSTEVTILEDDDSTFLSHLSCILLINSFLPSA